MKEYKLYDIGSGKNESPKRFCWLVRSARKAFNTAFFCTYQQPYREISFPRRLSCPWSLPIHSRISLRPFVARPLLFLLASVRWNEMPSMMSFTNIYDLLSCVNAPSTSNTRFFSYFINVFHDLPINSFDFVLIFLLSYLKLCCFIFLFLSITYCLLFFIFILFIFFFFLSSVNYILIILVLLLKRWCLTCWFIRFLHAYLGYLWCWGIFLFVYFLDDNKIQVKRGYKERK